MEKFAIIRLLLLFVNDRMHNYCDNYVTRISIKIRPANSKLSLTRRPPFPTSPMFSLCNNISVRSVIVNCCHCCCYCCCCPLFICNRWKKDERNLREVLNTFGHFHNVMTYTYTLNMTYAHNLFWWFSCVFATSKICNHCCTMSVSVYVCGHGNPDI